jgi:bifunctional oligoribonuclease and PAP phosphatase NrnA
MTVAGAGEFLATIQPGRTFVLTTHVHPDGDGIGTEVALARYLRGRGVTVRIINRDPVPPLLSFLNPEGALEVYDPARHDGVLAGADAIVMLDNSDTQRLEELAAPVRASRARKICIDHHPDPDPFWDVLLIDLNASCTGMIVFNLLRSIGAAIDQPTAVALYTALASDTGRFRFGNATPAAFRMAAELAAAGASPAALYGQLSETLSGAFLRLYGALLAGMETRAGERLVILRAPREIVEKYGAEREDLAEVINQALKLSTSRVAVLFREIGNGATKVSLRSKGEIDVNALARRHGGGGHRNASGIVLDTDLESAARLLGPELEALATA